MLPLFHDFGGQIVLVFGGGSVGLRKARFFAREARVVVVAREFADESPATSDASGRDDRVEASLVRAHLDPADVPVWFDRASPALVVAATDDAALNDAVESAARDRSVLVNRADQSGGRTAGSVVVPATVRDGDVVAAVATGGRSPTLSKRLRERIAPVLDGSDALAALVAEFRDELKARGVPPDERRDAVRAVVASEAVRDALAAADDGREATGAAAGGAIPEAAIEAAKAVARDSLGGEFEFDWE